MSIDDFEDIENWSGAQKIQASDQTTTTPEDTETTNDASKNKYVYPLIGVLLVAALLGGFVFAQTQNDNTETAAQETNSTASESTASSVATTTTTAATTASQAEETTPDYSQNPSRNPTNDGEIVVTYADNQAYIRGTTHNDGQVFTGHMCLGEKFGFEVRDQLIVNDSAPEPNSITIRNEGYLFNSDSAELKPDQTKILDALANASQNQNFQIELVGQAKVAGSRSYNHSLAHDRAEAVKSYLANLGVQSSTIKIIGLGEETDAANSEPGGNVEIRLTGFDTNVSNSNCG